MKPHLYFAWGIWNCRTFEAGRFILGMGYEIEEAYADWKQVRAAAFPSQQPQE